MNYNIKLLKIKESENAHKKVIQDIAFGPPRSARQERTTLHD
jgi:hypothetical protein